MGRRDDQSLRAAALGAAVLTLRLLQQPIGKRNKIRCNIDASDATGVHAPILTCELVSACACVPAVSSNCIPCGIVITPSGNAASDAILPILMTWACSERSLCGVKCSVTMACSPSLACRSTVRSRSSGFRCQRLESGGGYSGASRASRSASATMSRATATRFWSTVTRASACRRVTAR